MRAKAPVVLDCVGRGIGAHDPPSINESTPVQADGPGHEREDGRVTR
jgi:hypothetical protein